MTVFQSDNKKESEKPACFKACLQAQFFFKDCSLNFWKKIIKRKNICGQGTCQYRLEFDSNFWDELLQ